MIQDIVRSVLNRSDRRFEPSRPKLTKMTHGRQFSGTSLLAPPFYMPPALWDLQEHPLLNRFERCQVFSMGASPCPRVGPQRKYFGRNHRKWLETAQPMRQKAIQGLLSRFRWSPITSIFEGFLVVLNRTLSALFSKIGPQKNRKSRRQRWVGPPPTQTPHLAP